MKEFDLQNIFTDVTVTGNKNAALQKMAELFASKNQLDAKALLKGFEAREQESTTGFGFGVAIPHTKIAGLKQPLVGMTTFTQPINWESLDEQPVTIAIALLMPIADSSKAHLSVLAKFARKLMDEQFVADLQAARHQAQSLYQVVTAAIDFD